MCLRMQIFCNACDLFINWPLYEAGTHGKACLKDYISGTSLVVQWLRLTSNAGGSGSIPGQRTKTPHAMHPPK